MRTNDQIFRFTAALGVAAASIVLTSSLALATGGEGGEYGGEGGEYGGEGGEGHSYGYGDSAQLEIKGQIAPTCEFTTTPNVSSIGEMVTGNVTELGSLAFTCNIATSSSVNLTVKSANGALKRFGGSETVDYQVAWDIQGAVDAYATLPTSITGFNLLSGPNGVEQLGVYKVKVTGSTAGKPSGDYKDVVTYTISP